MKKRSELTNLAKVEADRIAKEKVKAEEKEAKRVAALEKRKEDQRLRAAAKKVSSEMVQKPAPTAAPEVPRATNPVNQGAADEAFALPYEPPSYHFGPNDDPYAELAQRELCRRKLLPFIQRFRPKYMAGWVHEDICRRIERFVKQVEQGLSPRLLLMMPPRSGKLLADDTLVPTPRGWITHGELATGSEVFHPSGKPVTVLAVSAKQIADVRVTFSDGSTYLCHQNHEWTLFDRKRGEWCTLEAGHFLRQSHSGTPPKLLCGTRSIYQLPVVEALEYRETAYVMHPYVLGAWLGDGSAGKPCITGDRNDQAISDKIQALGYPVSTVCEHATTGVLTTYFSGDGMSDAGLVPKRQGPVPGRMAQELEHLGIYKQKRIPAEYQRLATELRLELLAGLVDTDGTTDAQSRVTITTVSRELADDIMELATGLGFRPYIGEVQPTLSSSGIQGRRVCYVVGFQPTMAIPVTLERKRVRRFAKQRRVGLVSVERVPPSAAQLGHCIQVDSPDGLYVVGEKLTATHNSEISSRHTPAWILGQHPDWEIIAGSHTSSLSLSFSRYLRDVLRDPAYSTVFPDAVLDPSSQSVENWNLTKGGGYLAAGVGTGITGRGAHILLLDDLVKDMEAADSITISDNTWEWYLSTAYTRLAPGGGVLGLMCMTGDTPVMMADGSWRRLDSLKASDEIATYACGMLGATRVAAMRSSGHDSVFKMTTSSGKIVRANQRHPFLTVAPSGEVSWTRLKNLTTTHRIVTVKESGGNGKGSLVLPRDASSLRNVVAFAAATTSKKSGPTGAEPSVTTTSRGATPDSSIVTASLPQTTTLCTRIKAAAARFAKSLQKLEIHRLIGKKSSPSITATTLEKSEVCSVTTATLGSDTLVMSRWHYPPQGISDFTLDEIVSIEPDGYEEVFDVQVNCTENFIANGLVSHNTWWHDNDWAGRIQQAMASDEGADQFEIIRYPAINEYGDEYILADDSIVQLAPNDPVPEGARLTRYQNTAIHPARYTTEMMLKIKRNLISGGQKRVWDALYQQNPVPDEGNYFSKEMFRYYGTAPRRDELYVYQAWDFAISEGKESDYTVGTCIGVDHRDNVYVLGQRRFRSSDGGFIIDAILDFAKEHNADCLGFEDGQIWKSIEFQFKKRCRERRQYPNHEILKPLTDKMVRANPLKGRMQLGKVYFDNAAAYWAELQKEMLHFPAGKHDDQVDSLAWAIRLTLSRSAPQEKRAAPKTKSWKDGLRAGGIGGSHMAA
jgi:predicted phage terminase large subunit-like protein